MASEGEESLSASFDRLLQLYQDIESSTLPTNDPALQAKISEGISGLIRGTVLASELGIFSTNETLEDLTTPSVKLLLLPALLGTLTLKQTDKERPETLRLASVYLRDFLQRCFSYGVTKSRPPQCSDSDDEEEEEGGEKMRKRREEVKRNGPPTAEELQDMARQRQDKISRYKEKTQLAAKLDILRAMTSERPNDEEVTRKYNVMLVQKFAMDCLEELESVLMEKKMLKQMATMKLRDGDGSSSPPPPRTPAPPLKPILITRDAVQRNVFGLGYPSRPSMTVEEFYDQRVREGWFPEPKKTRGCLQDRATLTPEEEAANREEEEVEEEKKEEEDDPESLERARARDEWRDTHRRGWGNTYNRS